MLAFGGLLEPSCQRGEALGEIILPNGTIGDDPILDICVHRVQVFSPEVDRLVRQLVVLMSTREVDDLREDLAAFLRSKKKDITGLELRLAELKERQIRRAEASGWDLDALQDRLEDAE